MMHELKLDDGDVTTAIAEDEFTGSERSYTDRSNLNDSIMKH